MGSLGAEQGPGHSSGAPSSPGFPDGVWHQDCSGVLYRTCMPASGQTCCSSGRGLGLPMDGAEGDACCPGASVSPRRGGRPVSTTPAELPGAPPALGNQAKHESIPIPVCQEGPWGANCSPLSGHGRGCQDLDARPSPPAPGPQQTLQLHSGGLEAPALSLHLRCLSSPRGWPVLGLQLEPLSGGLAGPGHLGTLQGQD